jgi:hypothetical protein
VTAYGNGNATIGADLNLDLALRNHLLLGATAVLPYTGCIGFPVALGADPEGGYNFGLSADGPFFPNPSKHGGGLRATATTRDLSEAGNSWSGYLTTSINGGILSSPGIDLVATSMNYFSEISIDDALKQNYPYLNAQLRPGVDHYYYNYDSSGRNVSWSIEGIFELGGINVAGTKDTPTHPEMLNLRTGQRSATAWAPSFGAGAAAKLTVTW